MRTYKYLIFGAGPTGLTVAHSLLAKGIPAKEVLVLETESSAGGLCRSINVDGSPVDIGGGHFLDIKRSEVLNFLFRFMPENEWNKFARVSKIRFFGREIDHPLEANLWQLSKSDQVDYLESVAQAGCAQGDPMPEAFSDWVIWKFGNRIAKDYMLPYNRKIWSTDLNGLGTYWLHKLPNVSFRETLQSCLESRALGTLPAHGTFLYPKKFGYGELWRRMGSALGESLRLNCPVESIDLSSRVINGQWCAETIINTIPWTHWSKVCDVPREIQERIRNLRSISIDVDYIPEALDSQAHWIYEPNESVPYHRLLLRANFCEDARGYWTETNAVRSGPARGWRHRSEFAYPLNTRTRPDDIAEVLKWAAAHHVLSCGRWGKWEHMNSDVAVADALTTVSEHLESRTSS